MSTSWFYEPFYEIDRFMNELANKPEQLFTRRGGGGEQGGDTLTQRPYRPRMDLHEDDKDNRVTAMFEIPGLTSEQINIEVHNGRLIVSGEVKKPANLEEGGFALRERKCGKFSRTLQLPQGVKENEVKANVKDGILTVTFPKAGAEMAPKRITVT